MPTTWKGWKCNQGWCKGHIIFHNLSPQIQCGLCELLLLQAACDNTWTFTVIYLHSVMVPVNQFLFSYHFSSFKQLFTNTCPLFTNHCLSLWFQWRVWTPGVAWLSPPDSFDRFYVKLIQFWIMTQTNFQFYPLFRSFNDPVSEYQMSTRQNEVNKHIWYFQSPTEPIREILLRKMLSFGFCSYRSFQKMSRYGWFGLHNLSINSFTPRQPTVALNPRIAPSPFLAIIQLNHLSKSWRPTHR